MTGSGVIHKTLLELEINSVKTLSDIDIDIKLPAFSLVSKFCLLHDSMRVVTTWISITCVN